MWREWAVTVEYALGSEKHEERWRGVGASSPHDAIRKVWSSIKAAHEPVFTSAGAVEEPHA